MALQEISSSYHDQYGNIADDFSHEEKIAAVFVFTSPRDWVRTKLVDLKTPLADLLTLCAQKCLDLQICIDLLLSENGRLGTRSELNGNPKLKNHGYQQDGQPLIFWCNPDMQVSIPPVPVRLYERRYVL